MDRRSFIKLFYVVGAASFALCKLRTMIINVNAYEPSGFTFPVTFPLLFYREEVIRTPTPVVPSGGVDEHIVHFPFISRD